MKTYSIEDLATIDLSQDEFPAQIRTWHHNQIELPDTGTHYGFVYQGTPDLVRGSDEAYRVRSRMYFCLPGRGRIGGENSSGIVITSLNYEGTFSLGGAIASTGRFAYIDGGMTSLLISPIQVGDPCLHALYFPPDRDQTLHTHPSYRIGLVIEGAGEGETANGIVDLKPGTIFLIPADHLHKFRTQDQPLVFIVFHPDSETGFSDRNHPMLNRTFVNGISASQLPEIQTALESLLKPR